MITKQTMTMVGREQFTDDRYAAGNIFALPALPPAPLCHGAWMRRFNQLYATGIAVMVGAIIVPQYVYLVISYLDGPLPDVAHMVIAPMFTVGSLVSLALLVTAPIRVVTYLRERSARGNKDRREAGQS